MSEGAVSRQRLDKWLFFSRTVKTRSLAAKLVEGSKVRVNRVKIDKPGYSIKVGDVLTIRLERSVVVYKVAGLGERRGPVAEARLLYEDLTPIEVVADRQNIISSGPRPTKRDRRQLLRFLKQEM
ncbi:MULTISPECIES: RNA-binding S4 domain-containing protein [Bartonella]|uniref:RNA-binding S4 domain-containing protein n=1 Tax=Bartonella TaxID=773 RepID=UPI0018DD1CD6|nr:MULTISPECIES: RNA-binding S4 domain-containing protein [Bartonella]MBH9995671.1 RNA-binding S4 domain-containing protein [Bartonella sp. P0291]MBH9995985.1 RNA-binding S4 domain-containing protein [Bartonella sp. M0192]MBH9998145.1 RNA-binding S4 domain-containing protein [Bartonella sp. M0191]MBI0008287.1 RNA-binding S4 domain-containing protein [Bartonella sp. M0193]MBI0009436.1 RNA-binding S4 domain-containing protein [Bartonella sp. M0176]